MNTKRVHKISDKKSKHVTYIMSSSFRILDNHSLYYALSNYESIDIIIYRKPEGERQDEFFNSFVYELKDSLNQFGKTSIVYNFEEITILNDVVLDQGYLKEELELESFVIHNSNYSVTTVESNVSVPVKVTSDKEEYSARTIRSKIHKHLRDFIDPVLDEYPISAFENKALEKVHQFIEETLPYYHLKNHPELNHTSELSVLLKYGIISPIRIVIFLEEVSSSNKDSFIEELIVRRELSYNFVFYNKMYYDFDHMTYQWAYETMNIHKFDHKEYLYTIDDYINFNTHDPYFNAAMKEMVILGKMHGYMRMYWCKKIIEWSSSFKYAYDTAITLNNRYFLDGNTPNGYTGVAWCFGKHDRAWKERLIFGKIRYMNANGLKRKFDIEKYINKVEKEVLAHDSHKANNIN